MDPLEQTLVQSFRKFLQETLQSLDANPITLSTLIGCVRPLSKYILAFRLKRIT